MRGVAMVVVLAGLLASCGAEGSVVSKTLAHRQKSGTARAVLQRLLDGDGIGGVTFGQAPEVVAARLRRLVGAPVGAQQIRNGYRHYFCSFYYEEWDGLGAASDGRFFVAGLDVLFSNSRFIGYSYGPNNLQTDLNTWNQYANQPLMLATAKGLAVGDPLVRGQRLYGRAFVLTTETQGTRPNPRPPPLFGWRASTAHGRIGGGIGITRLVDEGHGTTNRTLRHHSIVGIGAGVVPNTPCRCPCLPAKKERTRM